MYILGIDLSGPANIRDTAVVAFHPASADTLTYHACLRSADDQALVRFIQALDDEFVAGIDAPLSYNPGGGDRPGDSELRRLLTTAGLPPGTVMAPTMTRMVYLTLRGMAVSRFMSETAPSCSIVEIHPAAAMVMRGAEACDLRSMKKEPSACRRLLAWLDDQGLKDITDTGSLDDHFTAACGCALGARHWWQGRSAWCRPADRPFHPFDYAC